MLTTSDRAVLSEYCPGRAMLTTNPPRRDRLKSHSTPSGRPNSSRGRLLGLSLFRRPRTVTWRRGLGAAGQHDPDARLTGAFCTMRLAGPNSSARRSQQAAGPGNSSGRRGLSGEQLRGHGPARAASLPHQPLTTPRATVRAELSARSASSFPSCPCTNPRWWSRSRGRAPRRPRDRAQGSSGQRLVATRPASLESRFASRTLAIGCLRNCTIPEPDPA